MNITGTLRGQAVPLNSTVLTMGWFIMFLIMAVVCLVAFSLDVLDHVQKDRSSCVAAPPAPEQLRHRAAGQVTDKLWLCDSRCVCKPSTIMHDE